MMNHPSKLTVKEAAAMMGVTPQFLRLGLQQGRFPFGTAVKFKRWSYYINPAKFYEYLSISLGRGGDMDEEAQGPN